jgi:uncharacterized protein YjbI with pentapeptide repeats
MGIYGANSFLISRYEQSALEELRRNQLDLGQIITLLYNRPKSGINSKTLKILKKFEAHRIDCLLLFLRWHMPIGISCYEQLIQYINSSTTIDFLSFKFTYQNSAYTLEDFANKSIQTSNVGGYADLRGCSLTEIKLYDKTLKNGCFNYCDFSNSKWQQVYIENCNFVFTSFFGARLAGIRLIKDVVWSECDFSNAFLNAIDFSKDSNRISCNWKFTELQYFYLMKYCALAFRGRFFMADNKKHSVFWMVRLPEEDLFDSANEYIEWFEGTHLKLQQMSKSSFTRKLATFIVMLITMNWRSIRVFSSWMLLLVSIFALIYVSFGLLSSGGNTVKSLLDAFYFSVITFTTLGYGDILPTGVVGKLVVITEVISGYIFLGLLLTILSRKIKWK